MGAGCHYTHEHTGDKAFWIDLDCYDEELSSQENIDNYELEWFGIIDDLKYIFQELGYEPHYKDQYKFNNGLATIELESTYDGYGIIVRLEPNYVPDIFDHHEDKRHYNLFMANYKRMYNRIKRELLKCYVLRIATGGYTSTKIKAA